MIHLPEFYKDLPRDTTRSYPSIRVFKRDALEVMTHVHPILPLLIWLPVVGLSGYEAVQSSNPIWLIAVQGFLGFLFWTLTEYVLHRFIFHYRPTSDLGKKFCFLMHGIHHADPVDPSRLVMPPVPAFIFSVIFYSIFLVILGPSWVWGFFAGFLLGYLAYDYTHYALHHFNPKTRYGKWLKSHHMLHHYVAPESRWGVSSPVWDFVFGTIESEVRGSNFSKNLVRAELKYQQAESASIKSAQCESANKRPLQDISERANR